jgi:hypothetical protein
MSESAFLRRKVASGSFVLDDAHSERRDIRYPLHLPVSLKVADKELHTRSENISLGGILLSSASLIPEGSTAEVAFGVASLPDTGTQSRRSRQGSSSATESNRRFPPRPSYSSILFEMDSKV